MNPVKKYQPPQLPPKVRQQMEIGSFWRASRMVRLKQKPKDEVDRIFKSILAIDTISPWYRAKMEELLDLNNKRD